MTNKERKKHHSKLIALIFNDNNLIVSTEFITTA